VPAAAAGGHVIRVLLVEDHQLFRDGVVAVLDGAPDIEVVGEATTGEEAVRRHAELVPDVVLMDIKLPGIDGIEATRRIHTADPGTGIVMLTMLDDDAAVFAALRAGGRGYVLKDAERGAMVRAIRAVAAGEAVIGAAVAGRVLDHLAPADPAGSEVALAAPEPDDFARLTRREREVLALVRDGLRNAEVAARLFITEKTVENHMSSILAKLQVTDRAQAIVRSYREGFVPPS
jgi:DNA-binding NarL/FixJ family response regulator